MEKIAKYFEKIIIHFLILMMMAIIVLSTIEFAIVLAGDLLRSPNFLPQINDLLEIFGFFLLILIGVELLDHPIVSVGTCSPRGSGDRSGFDRHRSKSNYPRSEGNLGKFTAGHCSDHYRTGSGLLPRASLAPLKRQRSA